MKKLFVYADFNWLKTPQLNGELSHDSIRGGETYGFAYDKEMACQVWRSFSIGR